MTRLLTYPGHELFAKNIVRADNCDLFAADGTRYVDLESGVWCTPLGHSHPRVIKALCEQAARISHSGFNYSSQIVEEAAVGILSVLGLEDDAEHSLTTTTHRELARRGFLVARRPTANVLRLDPALTIPSQDIDEFLTALDEILRAETMACD